FYSKRAFFQILADKKGKHLLANAVGIAKLGAGILGAASKLDHRFLRENDKGGQHFAAFLR
ncbi:hypothetical protein, partial [uncultured Dubosiella sp.]|uniref:hypothetical protein n=1 Tax=uncultured Dubosiella sp. TaxID=1937011 RepID=UPI0025B5E01B